MEKRNNEKGNQQSALAVLQLRVQRNDSRIFVQRAVDDDDDNDNGDNGNKRKRPKMNDNNDGLPTFASSKISPERALHLFDSKRQNILYESIVAALQQIIRKSKNNPITTTDDSGSGPLVLDISDFSLCALLAASTGLAGRVVSVEADAALGETAARVAQLGNGRTVRQLDNCFEILKCRPEQLSFEVLSSSSSSSSGDNADGDGRCSRRVDLLVAEPYYQVLEGWHLPEALNFYYTVRYLRRQSLLSESVVVLPSRGRILGCIIESEQLRSAYRPCGDHDNNKICGSVDHSFVNEIGGRCFPEFDLALPVESQYEYKALTQVVELGVLDYNYADLTAAMLDNNLTIKSTARGSFVLPGRCDALLVWIEYNFPVSFDSTSNTTTTPTISTMGPLHRQIVRMLPSQPPITVNKVKAAEFVCESQFGGLEGSIQDHSFKIQIILADEDQDDET